MSRFLLDDETLDGISKQLPDLERFGVSVMNLRPDFISIKFPPESNAPVAAVCLQDTLNALLQVQIGLSECLQHRVWFQERCDPPNQELSVIFMRFYIDAIVSQLYAAAEHLANGIICMLELDEEQIGRYRRQRVSQQSILGHFLARERPDDPLSKAVLQLAESREWLQTMDYRGNWVHDQPPTISGLGPVYERRRRWIRSDDGKSVKLGLGSGDHAEFSIDEVLNFVQPAIFQFVELFDEVVRIYIDLLGTRGITFGERGLQLRSGQRGA